MFEDKEETHESFGMMNFSRIQSNGDGKVLHGSDLKHNTLIEMQLHHGMKKRDLNHDRYYAGKRIAAVSMSQNQFSELITSMNMGDGIPVTLTFTEKDGYLESPKFNSVIETHENEFKEHTKAVVQDAENLLASIKKILSGSGTVKKAEREILIKDVEKVVREIGANMPYMETTFHRAMDKVVTDAKGTIEAFYQHRVIESGLATLKNNQLDSPKLMEQPLKK